MLALLVLSPLPLLLIAAAIKDAATMTIPNWISLAIAGSFLVIAPFTIELGALGANLLTAAAVLTATFAMFSLHWIGGGDAKLVAAAALWMGLPALPDFLIWTGIFGGGLSLALLGARHLVIYLPIAPVQGALGRLLEPKGDIPYGLAIAAGGLAAFPKSAIFSAIVGA